MGDNVLRFVMCCAVLPFGYCVVRAVTAPTMDVPFQITLGDQRRVIVARVLVMTTAATGAFLSGFVMTVSAYLMVTADGARGKGAILLTVVAAQHLALARFVIGHLRLAAKRFCRLQAFHEKHGHPPTSQHDPS